MLDARESQRPGRCAASKIAGATADSRAAILHDGREKRRVAPCATVRRFMIGFEAQRTLISRFCVTVWPAASVAVNV